MRRLAIAIVTLTTLLPMAALAFSVSPAIIDLSGARGAVATASVTVTNADAREKTYYLQATAFEPREDSDAPRFMPREEGSGGLPEWISMEERVRVSASGRLEVPVRVAVPPDALPGTHYAAIMVSDAPYDVVAPQGAPLQARVAVLLFFTVEGGEAKAALMDFLPTNPRAVRLDAAAAFSVRVQNQGDVVVAPMGTVDLVDALGRTVASARVNGEGSRVIPGRTRAFTGTLVPDAFALGPVTALLRLSYAPDAPVLFSSFSFFLIPVPVVASLGILALIAAILIVGRALRRRA